jgi:hypothetical protein
VREIIKAVAGTCVGDMLTPYAVAVAVQVAAENWTWNDTEKYGTELRDRIKELAAEAKLL